jgi:hypothetical protein
MPIFKRCIARPSSYALLLTKRVLFRATCPPPPTTSGRSFSPRRRPRRRCSGAPWGSGWG